MRQIPILMYHWFRQEGRRSGSRSPQLEITPELFARQMRWLSERGYRTVSLAQAASTEFAADSARSIVITFDDGTLDFQEHARPVLAELGMTATLFVVTDHVGGASSWDEALGEPARPLMDWDQLTELHRAGFEIGSHTRRHRVLTELSDDAAREELRGSREELTRRLGVEPQFVAYPRGFFEPRHKQMAREAGYRGACAVVLNWRDLRRSDSFALRRVTIKGAETIYRFRMRIAAARFVSYRRERS